MKKTMHTIFTILVFTVLIARILGWFLNFDEGVDKVLNTVMFTLIGIAYIGMGFTWDNKLIQFVVLTCGVLLIGFNFVESNATVNIIAIVCILLPMIIARLDKKREKGVGVVLTDKS